MLDTASVNVSEKESQNIIQVQFLFWVTIHHRSIFSFKTCVNNWEIKLNQIILNRSVIDKNKIELY